MIELATTLQYVKRWAKQVGELQLTYFRTNQFHIDTKSTVTDLVTEVDKKSEAYLIDEITKYFPSHTILAEESGRLENVSEYCWIIDPLDGTNNFVQGLPIFCVSIALQYQRETVLGVVYAPYLQELFYATKNGGAFLNNKKLQVANKQYLQDCVICTGFPYNKGSSKDNNLDNVNRILPKVRGFRRLGAAAYDLSLVAAGILDGFWEPNLNLWDIAAGQLLIKQAGGIIHSFRMDDSYSIVCGNPHIVKVLSDNLS